MRIAVDAMGGDRQPEAPVQGALSALTRRADLQVLLIGQEAAIRASLPPKVPVADRWRIVDAPEVIGPGDRPVESFRHKRQSSIAVGLELCRGGEADAFVSAGNTGALTAGSLLTLGPLAGVARPAMPVVLPTVDGRGFVLLDVGAHMDAAARNLFDYAVMGSLYAEHVRGTRRPRVALLNVGTEERKGTVISREAFAMLQASDLNFVGNIEGRNLFADHADVVVTDGFVGNVVIKALEGFGHGISQVMGRELRHSGLLTLLGAALAARTLRGLRKRMDYAEYGGVPFLGVGGVCVKCHGSSDARALCNGVLAAGRIVDAGILPSIAAALSGEATAGV